MTKSMDALGIASNRRLQTSVIEAISAIKNDAELAMKTEEEQRISKKDSSSVATAKKNIVEEISALKQRFEMLLKTLPNEIVPVTRG